MAPVAGIIDGLCLVLAAISAALLHARPSRARGHGGKPAEIAYGIGRWPQPARGGPSTTRWTPSSTPPRNRPARITRGQMAAASRTRSRGPARATRPPALFATTSGPNSENHIPGLLFAASRRPAHSRGRANHSEIRPRIRQLPPACPSAVP